MRRWGWILGCVVMGVVACGSSDPPAAPAPNDDAGALPSNDSGATDTSRGGLGDAAPDDGGTTDGGDDSDARACGGSPASQQIVAVVDEWTQIVDTEVTKVVNACKQMASDLAVPKTDIDAATTKPDLTDRVKAVCDLVVPALVSDRSDHPQAHIHCDLRACVAASDVQTTCDAECGAGQPQCNNACVSLADAKGSCPFAKVETTGTSRGTALAIKYFGALGSSKERLEKMTEDASTLASATTAATDISTDCIVRTVKAVPAAAPRAGAAATAAAAVIAAVAE